MIPHMFSFVCLFACKYVCNLAWLCFVVKYKTQTEAEFPGEKLVNQPKSMDFTVPNVWVLTLMPEMDGQVNFTGLFL